MIHRLEDDIHEIKDDLKEIRTTLATADKEHSFLKALVYVCLGLTGTSHPGLQAFFQGASKLIGTIVGR